MNEAQTRAEYIDPALVAAGWGVVEGSRILREHTITQGRLEGLAGRRSRPLAADYVLVYRNQKLAVVEAKAWDEPPSAGVAQAKDYSARLAARFAYSTNGQRVYAVDMQTGAEAESAMAFASPDELFDRRYAVPSPWRDRFGRVPTPDKSGTWSIRYYQERAVNAVLDAIIEGRSRSLLTLATGTGKTSIAFQIAWKLHQARWNLTDWRSGAEPTRRPRILFLADRNVLADQAFSDFTSFAAFADDALVRIDPQSIRKKGRVLTNGSIFFTIFQTFMSGPPVIGPDGSATPSPSFGEYPRDFFDFIIIDECHRGGANDESSWREILEYFEPAVQLGLTATPKRSENVDTYAYFGEPVSTYSLKDGINDGYLTPFKVRQFTTSLDEYVYTPDDQVLEGEVEIGRRYTEKDFNRLIEIRAREEHRVRLFMNAIDQREKTLVFCATQEHALAVRDLINQIKASPDPNYCHRVTADDGAIGDQWLRAFQDNEKSIPTVLTTSQKLSTGVDARNIRNIVLLRPINSMIEFKQIIGRGTRLFEGKDCFTIYDFVRAHHLFSDPQWDGEPVDAVDASPSRDPAEPTTEPATAEDRTEAQRTPRTRAKIKLADGKSRTIQHMIVSTFWHPDGTPMSAQQFLESLFGRLPEFFRNESELRELWSNPDTRMKLLAGLAEKGFGREQLAEMQRLIDAERSDIFDVLAHVAYALPPLTRDERAARARTAITTGFNDKQRAFLEFVLAQYVRIGVEELEPTKLAHLLKLRYNDAIADALTDLGRPDELRVTFAGFQKHLYLDAV